MLIEAFQNNAITSLNGGINSSVTSITVTSSSAFPASPSQFRIIIDSEIMLVTYVNGTTWTVERGVESTTPASHSNGAIVTHILTKESLNKLIAGPVGENVDGQDIYLMACHKHTDIRVYLMASPGGKRWNTIAPKNIFDPVSGTQRDPSLLFHNGKYYIAHTNSTNTFWTLLVSTDLVAWSKLMDVDMTSIASVFRVWAPEFFVDDDGTIRVFTTCSTGGSTTNFQVYEQHATASDLSAWSNPVIITGTSLRSNMIDAFVVKKNGQYHIWYKDDDTKYIEIMRSSSLTSGYTLYKTVDWAGWGSGLEAPTLVQLATGKWRIWLNENSGLDSVAVYWL